MSKRIRSTFVALGLVSAVILGITVWFQSNPAQVVQTKVSFHLDSDFGSSLIRIAAARGIFTKYGIDAELEDFDDGRAAIDAMLASPDSEIALATSAGHSFVSQVPANKNLRVLSQLANNEDNFYWVVKKGKGDGTVPGLKGLRLGFPEISGARNFLQLSLSDHGLGESDVTLVPLKESQFAQAMADDLIDAHPSRVLITDRTFESLNGNAYELHDVGAYDWFNVLSTTTEVIEGNPEVLKAIFRALFEAQSVSFLQPEIARQEIADSLKIEVSRVPENVISFSNIRLSNGFISQLSVNRRNLSRDQGLPESSYFADPREIIAVGPLSSVNDLVVHLD